MWSVLMIRVHCRNLLIVSDSYGPPYLIWNRYLMVPLTLYGTCIVWSPTCMYGYIQMYDLIVPPYLHGTGIIWSLHVQHDFFRPASKESTACPKKYFQIWPFLVRRCSRNCPVKHWYNASEIIFFPENASKLPPLLRKFSEIDLF